MDRKRSMFHEDRPTYGLDLDPAQRFDMSLFEINEQIAWLASAQDLPLSTSRDIALLLRPSPVVNVPLINPFPSEAFLKLREVREVGELVAYRNGLVAQAVQQLGQIATRKIADQVEEKLERMGIYPDAYGHLAYRHLLATSRWA